MTEDAQHYLGHPLLHPETGDPSFRADLMARLGSGPVTVRPGASLRFTARDCDAAYDIIGANCGPAALAAAIRQAFDQPDRAHAGETWRKVAEQLRPRWPKLADLMDASEHDVLAYMSFPRQHRTKLHSTNPIERLNKEVKRRADVVGIFPNEASIMRLIGAVLFEQNDERLTASRYMMVEAFAQIDKEEIDPILSITTKAA